MIYAGQLHKVGVCAYSNSHRKMEQDPKRGGTGPGLIIAPAEREGAWRCARDVLATAPILL